MTTPTVLTKDHITFIRKADRISMHFNASQSTDSATLRASTANTDAEMPITCRVQFSLYGPNNHHTPRTCFGYIGSAHFDRTWASVAQLLKAGDTLTLHWIGDSNGYVRVATFGGNSEVEAYHSLHMDKLELSIHRTQGKRPIVLTFTINVSICPMNSARMIQPAFTPTPTYSIGRIQ